MTSYEAFERMDEINRAADKRRRDLTFEEQEEIDELLAIIDDNRPRMTSSQASDMVAKIWESGSTQKGA